MGGQVGASYEKKGKKVDGILEALGRLPQTEKELKY